MNKAIWFWRMQHKGGSSSGHYVHRGRPGKRGGSLPGGGHGAIGISSGMAKKDVLEKIKDYRQLQSKPISKGDYVQIRNRPEFGGQVVGKEPGAYKVRTRSGQTYAIPEKQAQKISKEQAVKHKLVAST